MHHTPQLEHGRQSLGFSLAEVLVALMLIGVGVLAAAPMFGYAVEGNAVGADLGSVGAIAVERMEQLRSVEYQALAAGGSLSADLVGYSDLSDPNYMVRWQITDTPAMPGTKTVVVRVVAVRDVVGQQKQLSLTMLRGR